ncbi:MAG TPA: adenylate/guanylate cyclase domain-containing protein [Candidatus Binatia bacterium]
MPLTQMFQQHLRLKVIALTLAILILGFGILVILNIRRAVDALVAGNRETAQLLTASITTSIENGMLEGHPDIILRLVQELKKELKDVRVLDVYRRNGVEAFSDLKTVEEIDAWGMLGPALVERLTKMHREPGKTINDPLFKRTVETLAPQETYETTSTGRMLTFFRPLENRKECQDCHGEDHKVRGVVRVSLGLERLDADLRAARDRQLMVALVTILGVAVALTLFLGRLVLKPIALVAAAAHRIGGGDFDARVAAGSRDEIGALGRAVNDMAGRLQSAHENLQARNAELATALDSLKESMQKVELLEQVKGELVKFVPEAVTKLLEKNPNAHELEKREADVSVLFLDVEGYTRLSEQLPAQRLNRMIQDYFSSFLEIIRAHHGDVNETAGDGLMVIFQSEAGPARHAMNAATAAFQLLAKVATLNREFVGIYPAVAIHVGINSGPALVGATKLDAAGGGRWTFTASGPTTNLAARVAGLTKGGEVMVGPETAERIKEQYVLQDAGEHQLKNVSQVVHVYRLVPPGVYVKVESTA